MEELRFKSTRSFSSQREKEIDILDAVSQGLAHDGGLFYPTHTPDLSNLFLSLDPKEDFTSLAAKLTHALFSLTFDVPRATQICTQAFQFAPKLVALRKSMSLLELFHGPSSAFKDFGAFYLATLLELYADQHHTQITILTATSGDTGSAVAQAFYRKKGIRVVILYPSKRVSPLQERQLTCLGENIYALEIEGSFDDCQALVKQALNDPELKSTYSLSSANSINIGRLIPQSFYYVYAWNQLRQEFGNDIVFSVPSGNYGNLCAGLLAWTWGLPVRQFIAASNENDIVPKYLQSKVYSPTNSKSTYANAMDVGNPSNFERLILMFYLKGVSQGQTSELDTREIFDLAPHAHQYMAKTILGHSSTNVQIQEEISRVYREHKTIICPHTACGIHAVNSLLEKKDFSCSHSVILSTAHPAKFSEVIDSILPNSGLELPPNLEACLHLPQRSYYTKADYTAFCERLHELL